MAPTALAEGAGNLNRVRVLRGLTVRTDSDPRSHSLGSGVDAGERCAKAFVGRPGQILELLREGGAGAQAGKLLAVALESLGDLREVTPGLLRVGLETLEQGTVGRLLPS